MNELDEAIASGDRAQMEDELGDALFALATWPAAFHRAEEALRATLGRFERRASATSSESERKGVPHGGATLEEMDALWDEAKSIERQAKTALVPPIPGSPQALGKLGG